MFLDEKTKTPLRVSNPAITRDQECNRVAVTGTIDEKAKTIQVASIRLLEPYVARRDVK